MTEYLEKQHYSTAVQELEKVTGPDGKVRYRRRVLAADAETSKEEQKNEERKVSAAIAKAFGVDVKDPTALAKHFDENPGDYAKLISGTGSKEQKEALDAVEGSGEGRQISIALADKSITENEKRIKENSGIMGNGSIKKEAEEQIKSAKRHKAELVAKDEKAKDGDMIGRLKIITDQDFVVNLWRAHGSPTQ